MRITLYGATGATARLFTARALREGHVITAVARRPEAITERHPGLSVVKGDVMDRETLSLERDTDAVVFLAGPTKGGPHTIYADGVPNVIEAMNETGVKRLIVVTNGLMNGPSDTPVQRLTKILVRGVFLKHSYQDNARLVRLIRGNPLDWTVVRPPRLLNSPARGAYRTAVDDCVRGGMTITRADLADAVLRVLPDPGTHRHTVDVAY
ncbi:NAD(P)-dependent oxidoreductase [Nonomuraea typhae]|uniref:NAD(P)-dependent oxidoreductase n=1 Tax=Nonomuraea typhae TaxID=2603600 RepID=UPI0012FC7645|nr:NAD(P)H-binding protein [Nonomuraea typhae]